METLETKASNVARQIAEKQEEYIRAVLGATDWQETPIVDIVWVRQDIQTQDWGDGRDKYIARGPEATFERYGSPAPPMSESAVDGKKCEVQRVTRPLYEKMLREYGQEMLREYELQ